MRPLIILFLFATITYCHAISIDDAMKDSAIEIAVHGADKDLFEDKRLQIDIVNHKNIAVEITANPGFIFISEDEDYQNMILTEPIMIAIQPNSTGSVGFTAMCIQASYKSPGRKTNLQSGYYATGNLHLLSQYIYENNYQNHMGQDAMWSISDKRSLYKISGPPAIANPIRTFVADLIGVPFDSTLVNKNEFYVPPFINNYGLNLTFYLQQPEDIKLQLFDYKGDFVRDLMNKDDSSKGKYNMQYRLALRGLSGQKYYVRLYVGEDMRKEFTIVLNEG